MNELNNTPKVKNYTQIQTYKPIIEQTLKAIGEVEIKEMDDVKVYIKDKTVFALEDKINLYFRISEHDYQIIGDKYKIIRIYDRRFIFERFQDEKISSADDLLKSLTKVIWEMSGKVRT